MEIPNTIDRLIQAVLEVRPLARALAPPVRIVWPGGAHSGRLLEHIVQRLDMPHVTIHPGVPPSDLSFLEQCLSDRLREFGTELLELKAATTGPMDDVLDEAIERMRGRMLHHTTVRARDGVQVMTYAAGASTSTPVLLASACGMPVELCARWMRALADDHFVMTWETRGLFGDGSTRRELANDVSAQVSDVEAVMNGFGIERAHILGVCGGAIVALLAAVQQPSRVTSLSLWHGDYELGADCPKTRHQRSVQALLTEAAKDHASATAMRALFCESARVANTHRARSGVRPDLAHLLLYPFATSDLLFRYAHLNGRLMSTDVRGLLHRVHQPVLVVTSDDDATAHPAGSRHVAARLPRATLHVRPHGDHLSVFDAEPEITALARRFIAQHAQTCRSDGPVRPCLCVGKGGIL